MTKETYLALIVLYGIDKIREGVKIAGSEPFIHTAALKHFDAPDRLKLLESNHSDAYVSKELGITVRQVQKLRKQLRDGKKK